ncbi:endo-1,4-beta-xylanase [Parapedobacter sp. ISTM3]|uniref:endo-1,4-beta-xylanase n=1 Tax=Parapedobacter sp. ISTM3 TaxID=2800130 RepID=UPI0019058DBC|nr:endo-1,4-beta-xylanase [Parapedobacter sp. ISTM3]MBK1439546.1 endo-1,4-beta-xylanase [Parapedobacter sp. ISTM3]
MKTVHLRFLLCLGSLVFNTYAARCQAVQTDRIPSLKTVFQDDFLIGTCLNTSQIAGKDSAESNLIERQFNAITPENIMKAHILHPAWNRFDFELADKLVAYAAKHRLKVNGHTLIWHSQLPDYIRQINDVDSVRQYFVNHIETVASRYDGLIESWDVVNEALNEDGTLRNSIFLEKLGKNYIIEAFRLAQKAAPNTKLYYNDYNIEQPQKRAGAISLIKSIQAAGVRIDGVGIQGHWRADDVPMEDIEESIKEFSALGIEVMFTELDLSVLPNPWDSNIADIGRKAAYRAEMDPYPGGLPDSIQHVQALAYESLFQLFIKYRDSISRITFWGVSDGQSWLNNWPVRGRTNYPLLFDRQFKPKAAFYRVIAAGSVN